MRTDSLPRRKRDSLPPASPPAPQPPATSIPRALRSWLQDGRSQGWSEKTLADREWFFRRFLWWMENEERIETDLAALTPDLVRRFLTYVREPHPTGRFVSLPRTMTERFPEKVAA